MGDDEMRDQRPAPRSGSLGERIAARRVERDHAAGVHTDCDRATCEWWSRSEWARRGLAKDLTGR